MGLANLTNVLKIFGGDEPSDEERRQLFEEISLMTLARATSSDTNIQSVEVEAVQSALREITGQEITAADIRVAAASELYESAPLDKYLSRCGRKLDSSQRAQIATKLADIIRSDEGVRSHEIDFFNMVATALDVTPAELVGLSAD